MENIDEISFEQLFARDKVEILVLDSGEQNCSKLDGGLLVGRQRKDLLERGAEEIEFVLVAELPFLDETSLN